MSAIELCRTAALGGHTKACADCGLVRCAYNSCRNRHCPKCQGQARAWKDYRHHGKAKVMTLAADEFIRRFLLHTLPDGFHRIRHFGFLANRQRAAKLALCRRLLDAPTQEPPAEQVQDAVPSHRPDRCPTCGGAMVMLGVLARPAPFRPSFWDDTS
jgi:hypothetical protein